MTTRPGVTSSGMIAGVDAVSEVPADASRREELIRALAERTRRAAAELAEAADVLDELAAEPPAETVEPLLLTVEQAAKALGVGRTTAAELISSGDLPAIKIGKLRRIATVEVRRFVERRTRGE